MIPLLCLLLLGQELEKERALGEGLAAGIREKSDVTGLEEVDHYLQKITGRLTGAGSVRVELVRAGDRVEPIVLPGRLILVPVKLFAVVEDEAELAGALAHAMGHAALEHGFDRREGGTVVVQCPWLGCHSDTGKAGNPAAARGMLVKLQQWEVEADKFGGELAGKAGFDAGGWRRYVARVQGEAVTISSVLPVKAVRLAKLDEVVAEKREGIVTTEEFARVQEIVRGAVAETPKKVPSLKQ